MLKFAGMFARAHLQGTCGGVISNREGVQCACRQLGSGGDAGGVDIALAVQLALEIFVGKLGVEICQHHACDAGM